MIFKGNREDINSLNRNRKKGTVLSYVWQDLALGHFVHDARCGGTEEASGLTHVAVIDVIHNYF